MGSGNLEKARLIELLYIFKTLNSGDGGEGGGGRCCGRSRYFTFSCSLFLNRV